MCFDVGKEHTLYSHMYGRFENVMILGAPASVQFTPSFLRCMIQAAQGCFIAGNIVVAAKASNLFIHCMAICDMVPSINQASPLQVLALLSAVLSAPGMWPPNITNLIATCQIV